MSTVPARKRRDRDSLPLPVVDLGLIFNLPRPSSGFNAGGTGDVIRQASRKDDSDDINASVHVGGAKNTTMERSADTSYKRVVVEWGKCPVSESGLLRTPCHSPQVPIWNEHTATVTPPLLEPTIDTETRNRVDHTPALVTPSLSPTDPSQAALDPSLDPVDSAVASVYASWQEPRKSLAELAVPQFAETETLPTLDEKRTSLLLSPRSSYGYGTLGQASFDTATRARHASKGEGSTVDNHSLGKRKRAHSLDDASVETEGYLDTLLCFGQDNSNDSFGSIAGEEETANQGPLDVSLGTERPPTLGQQLLHPSQPRNPVPPIAQPTVPFMQPRPQQVSVGTALPIQPFRGDFSVPPATRTAYQQAPVPPTLCFRPSQPFLPPAIQPALQHQVPVVPAPPTQQAQQQVSGVPVPPPPEQRAQGPFPHPPLHQPEDVVPDVTPLPLLEDVIHHVGDLGFCRLCANERGLSTYEKQYKARDSTGKRRDRCIVEGCRRCSHWKRGCRFLCKGHNNRILDPMPIPAFIGPLPLNLAHLYL